MKRTILLIIIGGWLLVPTGTPDDVITFYIISKLGLQIYSGIVIGLILLMWHYKINLEKISKTMKRVFQ